jgi:hypothetical protein
MKKAFIILILSLGVLIAGLYAIDVSPASGPYYVGDAIQFKSTNSCFDYYTGTINFGDGASVSGVTSYTWNSHRYRGPGQYQVTIVSSWPYYCSDSPSSLMITINENRSIQVSPAQPIAGQQITCTAINFVTPKNIRWDMGDGTIYSVGNVRMIRGGSIVTHTYTNPGSYTIKAYDWDGNTAVAPVSVRITIGQPNRQITYTPPNPRVDQPVYFETLNFLSQVIDWNFGDGTIVSAGSTQQVHRYQHDSPAAQTYTVSARAPMANYNPVTTTISVLPENRTIMASPQEVRINQEVTATAYNFRGDYILWNFGDGSQKSGFHSEKHAYNRPGQFTITARDENGESQKQFTANVTVRGITDELKVEVAEIILDNGKYYKVVPKNSKDIGAILRMKMRGTGIVAGYWLVNGSPFEYFNEVAYQGELKQIPTRAVPGLPTLQPGIQTVTVVLTRPGPEEVALTFPVLKYFVLPYENVVTVIGPPEAFVAKEDEIPEFSWQAAKGGAKYQIAFANSLYPILYNTEDLNWINLESARAYTPTPEVWQGIKRNRWTYWKVRGLDSNYQSVAESDIRDIKVVVATAEIGIDRVTDLDGTAIQTAEDTVRAPADDVIVHGSITYKGEAKYLVLRVYADNQLVDQLLFRDVKKDETRHFETSVPNQKKNTNVTFQVLTTSSPAVIIGLKNLTLKR